MEYKILKYVKFLINRKYAIINHQRKAKYERKFLKLVKFY